MPEAIEDKLYVITCISNPVRYDTRYDLYRKFEKYMLSNPKVEFWAIEMAYGNRPFEITDKNNPHHVQVRSDQEIWHKENLLNILISRLPEDAKYIATIDADVNFIRPDWAEETIHQLQHYDVVQMFSECRDLDDEYNVVPNSYNKGLIYCYYNNDKFQLQDTAYSKRTGHCGYAWAYRKSALDTLGGLIDYSIIGSGDYQMACGLLGNIQESFGTYGYSQGYEDALTKWGEKAKKLRGNVGYVQGGLLHHWHGSKKSRGYHNRWQILVDYAFSPKEHLERDIQGLYKLIDNGEKEFISFRDKIRSYFRSRDEDMKRIKE